MRKSNRTAWAYIDRSSPAHRHHDRAGLGADYHRKHRGHREGRAGRRRSRRDGHVDRRGARHEARARDDRRERQLRVPQRHGRHLHGGSDDERVQDGAAARACRSAAATACRSRPSRSKSAARPRRSRSPPSRRWCRRRAASGRSPVTTQQVENLPINHGNFTSLVQLAPGVREAPAATTAAARAWAAPARTTS